MRNDYTSFQLSSKPKFGAASDKTEFSDGPLSLLDVLTRIILCLSAIKSRSLHSFCYFR